MNKEAALSKLGLSGNEDPKTLARTYGERLSAVQQQLVSAQTDAERTACQTTLSELVEAYELVTGTGRYTNTAANDGAMTVIRSVTQAATPGHDTLVRLEPGVVLSDRLELGALLGQGGMGEVYAARDRLKEEDVAIKVMRGDLLFSTEAKDRFLAEAKVSCSLAHPNIVRVHDVGVSGGYYYFSMERLKGQTLRSRIDAYHREGREFAVAEVTDIARQLIDALRYAHRYIVHRDLKPENIWLAQDGTVKLMDFGIARAYSSSQLTQTGMTLGTAYYMAPEQRVAAKDVDWRADQYSLGIVLYELFAGTVPTGAVRPLETIRRDLPKRYARALMRAMEPKPQDRFPSLNALLAEIEAPDRKLTSGVLVLIGAGIAAAAGGAFIVFNNQKAESPVPVAAAAQPGSGQAGGPAPGSSAAASAGAEGMRAGPPIGPPSSNGSLGAALTSDETSSQGNAAEGRALAAAAQSTASGGTAPSSSPSGGGTGLNRFTGGAGQSASIPSPVAGGEGFPAQSRTAARQRCIAQCERDDGECRSLNRRGRQECMRAVAFGSNSRQLTTTNPASASCSYFGVSRCDRAPNRDACMARMADRYRNCMDVLGGSIASGRQECEERARESDRLCMDELRDCRASCE
jgi:Protein kinase domain